jgi:putative tricarboxylic transport membrane protein
MFDVGVMIVCGVIGYGMRKIDLPIAPFVLGLILGPFLEKSLRTSLEMSAGDFSIFATRPLCLGLLVVAGLVLLASALRLAPAEVREASND